MEEEMLELAKNDPDTKEIIVYKMKQIKLSKKIVIASETEGQIFNVVNW